MESFATKNKKMTPTKQKLDLSPKTRSKLLTYHNDMLNYNKRKEEEIKELKLYENARANTMKWW